LVGEGDTGGEVENQSGKREAVGCIITGIMTKKPTEPIPEQRVLRFIKENRLFTAGQKLVVAVSGGADSGNSV